MKSQGGEADPSWKEPRSLIERALGCWTGTHAAGSALALIRLSSKVNYSTNRNMLKVTEILYCELLH